MTVLEIVLPMFPGSTSSASALEAFKAAPMEVKNRACNALMNADRKLLSLAEMKIAIEFFNARASHLSFGKL
jgi:hypothetical protein